MLIDGTTSLTVILVSKVTLGVIVNGLLSVVSSTVPVIVKPPIVLAPTSIPNALVLPCASTLESVGVVTLVKYPTVL